MDGTSMAYEKGFEDGKADAANNLMPKSTFRTSTEYRNGYSDGYFAASGKAKIW